MHPTLQIRLTDDGSPTLYDVQVNEIYHSQRGAVQESMHVFVNAGLHYMIQQKTTQQKKVINLLEVGFGTGLNTLLTWQAIQEQDITVNYVGIEPFPISADLLAQLDYPAMIEDTALKDIERTIHISTWDEWHSVGSFFNIYKFQGRLQDFVADRVFDLVYFDAFAPEKYPELWQPEIFARISTWLNAGSALVTYCAKGQFKRDLKRAGFHIERLPGPIGKREMTRAVLLE